MSFRLIMFAIHACWVLILIPGTKGKIFSVYGLDNMTTTNEIRPQDEYSVYQKMMMNLNNVVSHEFHNKSEDIKQNNDQDVKPGPNITSPLPLALQTATDVFNVVVEVGLMGLLEGFLPHVERQRREAPDFKKNYIDIIFNFFGALVGRQQCSEILACR